ncbi:MAG TPA: hypothetical protein VE075_03895, partial [Thermoanaerobaculia bacterium]|nr:hypothetical protein [Thermoanaerobaculia bacterium]
MPLPDVVPAGFGLVPVALESVPEVVLPVALVVLPAGFGLAPVALVPVLVLPGVEVAPVLSVVVLVKEPLVAVLGVVLLGVVLGDGVVLVDGLVEVDGLVLGVDVEVAPLLGVELVPDVWAAAARAAATSRLRNREKNLRCIDCSSRSWLDVGRREPAKALPSCCEMDTICRP